MNSNDFSIALFSFDWRAIGFISASGLSMTVEDPETSKLANWVLDQLKDRDPQLMKPIKDESGCVVGFETASLGSPQYPEALRDELRRANLKAYVIPEGLEGALTAISGSGISSDVRQQVVPNILGLPLDQALGALEAVLSRGL